MVHNDFQGKTQNIRKSCLLLQIVSIYKLLNQNARNNLNSSYVSLCLPHKCVKTLSQVLALRVGYTEPYKGPIQTSLKGGWVAGLPPIRFNPSNLDTTGLFFPSHLRCAMVFNLPSMHVKLASWLAHLPNCISVQVP
jgi:hypothetical protein